MSKKPKEIFLMTNPKLAEKMGVRNYNYFKEFLGIDVDEYFDEK
jgi:hypothetical protein